MKSLKTIINPITLILSFLAKRKQLIVIKKHNFLTIEEQRKKIEFEEFSKPKDE